METYEVPAGAGETEAERAAKRRLPAAPAIPAEERPPEDRTVYRVPVGSSPVLGKATAPVTIVEFADFQCPYCVRAEPAILAVRARYGDRVRFVWKNAPLPFHDRAEPAAELALEARAQKGEAAFWKAHDLLLKKRGQLEDGDLADVAAELGLRKDAALKSVAAKKHAAAIEDDLDLADDVDATGTPTFFINGKRLVGAQPFDRLADVIDAELASAEAKIAGGVPADKLYETIQQGATSATLESVQVPAPTTASPSRGPRGAKVVVQIWSDFECPFCKRVEPTLAQLDAAFPGQIRVVWHNNPLSIHRHAMRAAEAAMEAYAQKGDAGFWKMHDLLIENQGSVEPTREAVEKYAAEIGLDLARFRVALERGVHRDAIEEERKIAANAGLNATPGFVINGYRVVGAQALSRFKRVVRRALAAPSGTAP
jgi:protein-disulfide isomerase